MCEAFGIMVTAAWHMVYSFVARIEKLTSYNLFNRGLVITVKVRI